MELEKYREIVKWIRETFPQDKFFRDAIVENLSDMFGKLPDEYLLDYTENPNLVIVNDSKTNEETSVRRDAMLNPFS